MKPFAHKKATLKVTLDVSRDKLCPNESFPVLGLPSGHRYYCHSIRNQEPPFTPLKGKKNEFLTDHRAPTGQFNEDEIELEAEVKPNSLLKTIAFEGR